MNRRTKIFILALIIIIIILTLVYFLLPKPVVPPSPLVFPTPIPQGDSGILEKQEEIRTNQYPLIDKTPYKTTFFEVSYIGPLKLRVVMFDKDKEKIKNEVEGWMRENGVEPRSHQIEYTIPPFP